MERLIPTNPRPKFLFDSLPPHTRYLNVYWLIISSLQLLSRVWLFVTMDCSMPGFPIQHQLPELAQTHVHWVTDAIQPSHPVIPFSSCLQFPSASGSFPMTQFFASGGQSTGVFSFSISPFNEYSGPISFRMDWLDLLEVQGTLKSLLQHHSSKSIDSLVLSLLYGPTFTSVHDYQKNHSFD